MSSALKKICCLSTDYCKGGCFGLSRNQNIKLTYNLIIISAYIIVSIVGWIKNDYTSYLTNYNCISREFDLDDAEDCVRQEFLYRTFISISFMFFLLGIFMCLRSQTAKIINEGMWLIKLILIVVLSAVMILAFDSRLVSLLQHLSVYLLPFYYFAQSLVIIDGIYSIDRFFNNLVEDSIHNKVVILKAIFSISSVLFAISLNVLSYYFATIQMVILNSILMGIFFLVILLRLIKGLNLLIWGCFWTYINVLTFLVHSTANQQGYHIIGGIEPMIQEVMTVIFLLGIITSGSNKLRTPKSSLNQLFALNTSIQEEEGRYISSNKWIVFHIVMGLAVLTLPAALDLNGETEVNHEESDLIGIQRLVGLIIAYLLFFWSLICTRLYPQRDFSELENYFKEFELS